MESSAKNTWGSYMLDVYSGRRGPQPLGTVLFEEIEAKAREKLKDYGGAFVLSSVLSIIYKV
jgi:lactate 2-monooxygenase